MPRGFSITHATGAFGRLFALWLLGCTVAVANPCAAPPDARPATARKVVDGDTLVLADGTRVRMVGLDAPELARDGAPGQPFARDARAHLETLVGLADARVLLAGDGRDRYGRMLAVVYSDRHGDLAAHLIRNGLALSSPVPPNLTGLACRERAERDARAGGKGLWDGHAPVAAAALARTGFAVVRGRAGVWRERGDDRLLLLDESFVVRVRAADAERWFDGIDFGAYAGRDIEVRGWIHPWGRDGRAITLQHPAAIEVLGD